jgi:hypothetical protein
MSEQQPPRTTHTASAAAKRGVDPPPTANPSDESYSAAGYYIELTSHTGTTMHDDAATISPRASFLTQQSQSQQQLTSHEVAMLRQLLASQHLHFTNTIHEKSTTTSPPMTTTTTTTTDRREVMRELRSVPTNDTASATTTAGGASSVNSNYLEFRRSTHAWAVFADDPHKRATSMDRFIGVLIIVFQLFTYYIFAREAIQDYSQGQVLVKTSHSYCVASNQQLSSSQQNDDALLLTCEANYTNWFDAFIAYFMLGVFLTGDFLKAARVVAAAPPLGITTFLFACLTGIEIVSAYIAACISVSYNLYIGELTDAVAVGVGLLFIRELSQRAYTGIRYGNTKQYTSFFGVLTVLIGIGMMTDPYCEYLFVDQTQYR